MRYYQLDKKTYKELLLLYKEILENTGNLFKNYLELDTISKNCASYIYMYKNGYLSFNHTFTFSDTYATVIDYNHDILGGLIATGTGICRNITSFFTDSALIQLLVFVIVSIVALFVTAPIVEKVRKKGKVVPTNLDRVIGKQAEVVKEIKPNHYGEVQIFGTTWTATSEDTFKVGDKVIVDKIDGVKLIVKKEEKK